MFIKASFVKLGSIVIGLVALSAVCATVHAAERDISPVISHFGTGANGTLIGAESASVLVTVTNNHASSVMDVSAFSLQGDASQYNLKADNCSGQSVAANGGTCTFEVSYKPTQLGSRLAYAAIATDIGGTAETITAFFSNDEDDQTQVKRRLPAVLNQVLIYEGGNSTTGTLVDTETTALAYNTTYSIKWVLLGYADSYDAIVAGFVCADGDVATCGGDGTGAAFSTSMPEVTSTSSSGWSYLGKTAGFFEFETSFTTPASGADEILALRFYDRSDSDITANESDISLLIPGNLSRIGKETSVAGVDKSGYIGTDGRRIYIEIE